MAEKLTMPEDPPPLRVVLVDDEPAASSWLADLLERYDHVTIVGRAVDADGAEQLIRQLRPDVVFVDIEMPGRDGLAVIDRLDGKTRGVVVTAFDEYAVEAFDTAAVDYLLKPVTVARLDRTLARLAQTTGRQAVHGEPPTMPDQHASPVGNATTLPVPASGATAVIALGEILWIEAEENTSRVHRAGAASLFVRQSLARWEETLPADDFLRVSRSVILRLDRIEGIRWDWQRGTELTFRGSTATLTIGRPATRRLKDRLQETHPQRSRNDDLKDPFPSTR